MRLILLAMCFAASGCFFSPREVKVLPDTPVLIGNAKNNYVEIFGYSKETKSMIHIGWVDLKRYEGWTLTKFDWSDHVQKEGN